MMPKSLIRQRIRKLEDEVNSYQHNPERYAEYMGRIKELYNVLQWRKYDEQED
jgi:hypothetical protein